MGLTARGFSLVELLVAMGIATTVMGGVFTAVQAGYGRFGVETEASDTEQRLRVASDALYQGLVGAVAILPSRPFPAGGDPPGTFRTDAVTVVVLIDEAASTTTVEALPAQSTVVHVNAGPGCPVGDPACGFVPGDTLVVRDGAGGFDPFEVAAISGAALTLMHLADDGPGVYPAGSAVAKATVRSFFVDAATGQLVRADAAGNALPVVDGVTDLVFEHVAADGLALSAGSDPRSIRRVSATLRLPSAAGSRVARVTVAPRNLRSTP